ncbi:hypothetical protein H634G_01926 [Metarhizium anisopliae BRIP 53293]|uniref:Uncharacterized protein n=1 Tax=Metarhizium anisopliae BRIP 53293 TaxID=1291518 RepID=A0A0D9P993_METAN|nr:hypothetical protein H634G_01926 [Metarhizium anisopliae BRIP 53293]KJK93423.1 hypothetical protein H633G_02624 [Metarhizium anisopliae BRIP 53284]
MSKALQVTSLGWLLISLGHTTSAKDWQENAKFQTLPRLAYACAKAGWYQGSGFFIMNGTSTTRSPPLINYAWSKNPALLRDPVQKAVAGAMIAIMWASGWWYAKNGVTSNAVAVGAIGALQGYSAFTI